ncbi:MAG: hypothetical protein HYZ91_05790 [Candidatus Omnitrophica bacterium]|nr:hypothetical protein [Candidatus Omnitrophota bacterium]
MDRRLRAPLLSLAGVALLLVSGCDTRPTYPKARLAEALKTILQGDRLNAAVRLIDHTLAVHLAYPGALAQHEEQITIGPSFDEAARKVLIATHRVLLSTDAEPRFYVLLISDPQIPGAYVTMVRYVDDVRRANANMLDTPEIFARTIFELNVLSPNPVTLEQYVPRDIRLEEFLSWQLARRIQHALMEEPQLKRLANVGRCGGRFENGEFAFTLNVVPSTGGGLDEATIREVFQTSTNIIARVLSSYHFQSFQAIRLIHPLTGRTILLPKTQLELFK